MFDESAYRLDIRGLSDDREMDGVRTPNRRPWLGIRFDCCGVYVRVYRDAGGAAYVGRCPRCLREVRLRVAPGGTSSRFFTAQ